MNRRAFIKTSMLAAAAGAAFGGSASPTLAAVGTAMTPRWRAFEMRYRVTLAQPGAGARLWLPLPQDLGAYQRVLGVEVRDTAVPVRLYRDPVYGAAILEAEWPTQDEEHTIEVVARVATRDRSYDPTGRANLAGHGDAEALALFLKPTASMPVDGIVRETALKITAGAKTPLDSARAIYDWIVDSTFRDPEVRGCGIGDIRFMLESGNLGGKCADINSLYVGLARAAGLPAREVFGIRVAESNVSKSLGKAGDITKAQHCRAEVHLPDAGWVAVDPADVRKVVLEEKLPLHDPHVRAVRRRLFGNWEMNWVGLNYGRDFRLGTPPGGTPTQEPLGFFMYPYAETVSGRPDHLSPETFRYQVAAREIAPT